MLSLLTLIGRWKIFFIEIVRMIPSVARSIRHVQLLRDWACLKITFGIRNVRSPLPTSRSKKDLRRALDSSVFPQINKIMELSLLRLSMIS